MRRDDASNLLAFLAVARERSFTRAAAKLGMTQSALSQIVRNLEERIGVRLFEPDNAERHSNSGGRTTVPKYRSKIQRNGC